MTVAADSVAILADVHGNPAALRAVLADLERRSFDAIVLAGDYALFGPRPGEAVGLLRELDAPAIHGNTEVNLLGDGELFEWTRADLGADHLAWLAGLPFSLRVRSPRAPRDAAHDLLLVHATPEDLHAVLVVSPDPAGRLPLTPPDEAARLVGDAVANLIVYGHIHFATAGVAAGRRCASVGSIGLPFDLDPRAAYAIADWRDGRWELTHHRVAYDHEAVAREIEEQDAPLAAFRARRVREAQVVEFPAPGDATGPHMGRRGSVGA